MSRVRDWEDGHAEYPCTCASCMPQTCLHCDCGYFADQNRIEFDKKIKVHNPRDTQCDCDDCNEARQRRG